MKATRLICISARAAQTEWNNEPREHHLVHARSEARKISRPLRLIGECVALFPALPSLATCQDEVPDVILAYSRVIEYERKSWNHDGKGGKKGDGEETVDYVHC